jgi:hypothetical protein
MSQANVHASSLQIKEMLEYLLVYIWNGIDVIKKLHLCYSRCTPEEYQEIL